VKRLEFSWAGLDCRVRPDLKRNKRAPVRTTQKEFIMVAFNTGRARLVLLTAFAILFALSFGAVITKRIAAAERTKPHKMVIVPGEDRFSPFALSIRSGEDVQWINMDTDDHTIVSNDFFNTAGNNGTDMILLGTDNNNGKPGTFMLHFSHPGTFNYYCRFHAHLDDDHQPVAPGPRGGTRIPTATLGLR